MEPVATCCFENFWQQSRIHTEAGDERRSIRPARRAWIPSLQTVLGLLADHCPALPTRTDGSFCSILELGCPLCGSSVLCKISALLGEFV